MSTSKMEEEVVDDATWFLRIWCRRLGIAIPTVLVAYGFLVVHLSNTSTDGVVTCPEFRFDSGYIHSDLTVLEEGSVLTNTERFARKERKQLKTLRGIVGILPVSSDKTTVYLIGILFSMKTKIRERTSLLQIGFVERRSIDESANLNKAKGLVLSLTECSSKSICLVIRANGTIVKERIVTKNIHDSSHSSKVILVFKSSTVLVAWDSDSQITEILHKFENLDLTMKELWPVYGLCKPELAIVTLSVVANPYNAAQFDKMTCHDNIFVSSDGMAVSNMKSDEEFQTGFKIAKHLYRGASGDMSFKANQLQYNDKPFYFVLNVTLDANMRKIDVKGMIFEVGFGPRDLIEKHSTMKHHPKAWSVHVARCTTLLRLCVQFMNQGTEVKRINDETISDDMSTAIELGIRVEPNLRYIAIYNYKGELMYIFNDVNFSSPLYPIFGMTDKAFVKMRLLTRDKIHTQNVLGYFLSSPSCDT